VACARYPTVFSCEAGSSAWGAMDSADMDSAPSSRRCPSMGPGFSGRLAGGSAGFRGVRGEDKPSRASLGGAAQRARCYDVLDVVDFGGSPGASPSRPSSLWSSTANAGKLILRRSEAIKDSRKRWHDEKPQACVDESAADKAVVLANHLSLRQPSMSAIVSKAQVAEISPVGGEARACASRRYRRGIGRH
jgi:hypothetical protein